MTQYDPLFVKYPPASIPEIVAHIQKYLVDNGVIPGVASVCGVVPNDQRNIPLTGSDIPIQAMSVQTVAQAIGEISTALSNLNDQIVTLGPYNGLDSDSTTAALSAAQGKVLNTAITTLAGRNNLLIIDRAYTPTDGVFEIVCSVINASRIINVIPFGSDVEVEKIIISNDNPLTYRITLADRSISTSLTFEIIYIE